MSTAITTGENVGSVKTLLASYSPEELQSLIKYLTPEERAEAERILTVEACRERIVSHKAGPMLWVRNLTATTNKQWNQHVPPLPPVAPLPYKPHPEFKAEHLAVLNDLGIPHDFTKDDPPDYLDVVMGLLLTQPETWIPKTREMMTSWLVVHYIAWECQFFPSIEWLSQSEKEEKAFGLIEYANALYVNQPQWLKNTFPLKRGRDEGSKKRIEWAHDSRYIALPQGERQSASSHPTGYFNDETAHQDAALATVDIVRPACRKVICVSSVAPSAFWDVVNVQGV